MPIQALDGEIAPEEAGMTLAHEHVWAAFGAPSGDPDLDLTCAEEVLADLAEARAAGVATVVDVTTTDMGADSERTASIAARAGVRAVKSTGWFRSPTADAHVADRSADALAERLVADLTDGFAGTERRAGCLGEVGLSGSRPTAVEERVLEATAAAARATGAGVVLHTDDAPNARALVAAFVERGLAPTRLLVGHARVADPLAWHVELAQAGATIGFDQLGHPKRDTVEDVAPRIVALLERVPEARVAISADVGRRSRLCAFGGSGYAAAPCALLGRLRAAGVPEPVLARVAGGAAAELLALGAPS
jgi:phosphotriesterase-related protein